VNDRAKTAFVFAGGGSLGAIQVGMLKALVARGFTADFVVGSSVGAINAAHFAGDPTPAGVARLEALWRGLRRADVFPLPTLRNVMKLIASGGHLVDSVMPTGYFCTRATPPRRAIGRALHALNVLVAGKLVNAVHRFGGDAEILVVPPLCPLDVSPFDFGRTGELIERAAEQTKEWIEHGVQLVDGVPHQLIPHTHRNARDPYGARSV
jgi:hypothetical protein